MASIEPAWQPGRAFEAVSKVASLMALAGGIVVLAAATLVTASVLLRWITSQSIAGDFEWVQLAVAVAAFCYFPICQAKRGHIYVDTFTSRLPPRANRWLDALWDVVYAAFSSLIAWRLAAGALETIGNKTTTMVLGLPIGWAMLAASILSAFVVLVAVLTAAGGGRS